MHGLCEDCNITSSYFENSVVNYSTNGQQLLFTTDFIYSNPRGTVTSTSLIHHFQSWILSQNTPNLTVAGKIVSINKNCPVVISEVTSKSCLKLLQGTTNLDSSITMSVSNTDYLTNLSDISATLASVSNTEYLNPISGSMLVAALVVGALIASVTIITIIIM